jgi:hypothetical protein
MTMIYAGLLNRNQPAPGVRPIGYSCHGTAERAARVLDDILRQHAGISRAAIRAVFCKTDGRPRGSSQTGKYAAG